MIRLTELAGQAEARIVTYSRATDLSVGVTQSSLVNKKGTLAKMFTVELFALSRFPALLTEQ